MFSEVGIIQSIRFRSIAIGNPKIPKKVNIYKVIK